MTNMRMPKGWVLVGTNRTEVGKNETRQERANKERKFTNAIRNVKSPSIGEMKKESDRLFDERNMQDAQLLQAFAEKRLKSKALIKRAKALKRKKEEEAKKAADAEKVEVAISVV